MSAIKNTDSLSGFVFFYYAERACVWYWLCYGMFKYVMAGKVRRRQYFERLFRLKLLRKYLY